MVGIRNIMRNIIEKLLAHLAKKILARYQPRVVAITGSVGKTSAKNAIAAVLGERFSVRVSPANYNTEFGVPLSIINADSPGNSAIGWLSVIAKATRLAYGSKIDFPEVLVLEYGTDKPGDLDHLCDIAKPEVGVVTRISPVHVENFGTLEKLIEEKATLVRRLAGDGLAVLNADDEHVLKMRDKTEAQIMTYGFSALADIRADNYSLLTKPDIHFEPGEVIATSIFSLEMNRDIREVSLDNIIGLPAVFAALAGIAVGKHFGLELAEMIDGLKNFKPMPGRLRILPGIKGSILIDDSYNAAPASMIAALDLLREFPLVENNRRIAALGDMLELGSFSEEEHRKIGKVLVEKGIDVLVAAGERARDIARGALEAGMSEANIQTFRDSEEAGRWLDRSVESGDVILIKGSQGARMEKVTKDLLAEPLRAKELIVRQYPPWVEEG